uniref:Phospholipase n=1 Tax=Strigamia maritima TaxID=126957 RepID=T1J7Z2_STRMM
MRNRTPGLAYSRGTRAQGRYLLLIDQYAVMSRSNSNLSPPGQFIDSPDSEFDELQFPDASHDSDTEEKIDGEKSDKSLPFSSLYDENKANRPIFLPNTNIEVEIIDVFRVGTNLLNPYLYIVQLKHGNYQWLIRRRYRHFQHLHHQLGLYYASLRLPIPIKKHKERRKTLKLNQISTHRRPRFPQKPDALIGAESLSRRSKQLEEYLQSLLSIPLYRTHPDTLAFLEVSRFSFVDGLGEKMKEGIVKKRAGGHRIVSGWKFLCYRCKNCCSRYSERWLLIKDTYIAYVHPQTGRVHFVILLDQGFDVQTGIYYTGIKDGILISNLTRRLLIKGFSGRSTKEWYDQIVDISKEIGGREFTQANRFVDGLGYFEAIADALEAAKEEIFITDWMLSPEIFLKRPILEGQKWRLDKILERKAKEGVKIFVLLYKEVELALGINSLYSKQRLVEKHPQNIKVLRHPDVAQATLLWAHHEKIVVIDQTYAFLGGLDLCYGRWDTHEHRLVDLGGVIRQRGPLQPGSVPKTSSTPNIPGFGAFAIFHLAQASHDLSSTPLKPVQTGKLRSSSLQDIEKNATTVQTSRSLLLPTAVPSSPNSIKSCDSSSESDKDEGDSILKIRLRKMRRHKRNKSLDNDEILGKKSKITQESLKSIGEHGDIGNLVDRTKTPRMPWHDIGIMVQGKAGRDVARHFIQRWNFTKSEKAKEHPSYPWLLPKSYSDLHDVPNLTHFQTNSLNCQVLRSVSTWSAGVKRTEQSIHDAYVDAIENAKHFIYIENQFFITQSADSKDVCNKIGDALYRRIVRAHKRKAVFRVYVVLPLLPAFEGEFGTVRGAAIQAITHWNYVSICRGPDSLMSRLKVVVGDPTRYITFYGLRNSGILFNDLVSELVYVHSKLLIVDDELAIIGSANINDRSMLGKRDSEIAVIIEDTDKQISKMAGQDVAVGKAVSQLRQQIFKEFLGVTPDSSRDIDVSDPISETFFKNVWLKIASLNTAIFEKVFNCIPTDLVHSFSELKSYQAQMPLYVSDRKFSEELIGRIRGFLVLFPLQFLCNESLTPAPGTKEALMPTSLWV